MDAYRATVDKRDQRLFWLVGKDGTRDILIARTQREAGRALAKEFGAMVALPVEEKREPY